jgi:hypothetical protein
MSFYFGRRPRLLATNRLESKATRVFELKNQIAGAFGGGYGVSLTNYPEHSYLNGHLCLGKDPSSDRQKLFFMAQEKKPAKGRVDFAPQTTERPQKHPTLCSPSVYAT